MMWIEIAAGFVLLLVGAEILVRGAVGLARTLGISPLIIGMTVVALGTSAPEFVVSLNAALADAAGLATGNIIGSNIANVLLILGAAALIKPVASDPASVKRDGFILIGATALFIGLCLRGPLDLLAGILLFGAFAAFIGFSIYRELAGRGASGSDGEEAELEVDGPRDIWKALLMTVAGIAGVLVGADLLVSGGTTAARSFGVSEEVIGLTLIAIGTSLPELAATAMAALRGHSELAIGNVIGSNLFNILGVLGGVAMIQTLPVGAQLVQFDLWIMAAATLALIPFLMTRLTLTRTVGVAFLVAYTGYIAIQAFGVDTLLASVTG